LIDCARASRPTPLIVLAANQRQHFIGGQPDPVNLFGFEIKDRQFLPLQRVGEDLI